MHDSLKQATKGCESVSCCDCATFYGRIEGFGNSISNFKIPIPDRTQGRLEGREGQSQEVKPLKTKAYSKEGSGSALEKEKVTNLALHDPACHNGGAGCRNPSSPEACPSGYRKQYPFWRQVQKGFWRAERAAHYFRIALCRQSEFPDSLATAGQTRETNARRSAHLARIGLDLEPLSYSRHQLLFTPRLSPKWGIKWACEGMA
jgi:hypothetical protein